MIKSLMPKLSALSLILMMSTKAFAQLIPPGPFIPPLPQTQPTQSGTVLVENGSSRTVTVRWFESAVLTSSARAQATHFVVCVQDPTLGCAWPAGSPLGVFAGPATGSIFTRTPVVSGSPFGGYRILLGYNYSTDIVLNNRFFDRQLKWSVAACAAMYAVNCSTAVAGTTWYTTKELVANANINILGPNVEVTAQGANIGTTRADNFTARVGGYPALVGRSGLCAVDPNEVGLNVTAQTRMITRDGQYRLAGDFWNGVRYDVSSIEVAAIVNNPLNRALPLFTAERRVSLTSQGPLDPAIPPAVSPMIAASFPVSNLPAQSGVMAQFAVAVIADMDADHQITEANENDNKWAECSSFFR